jgi:hypothetical protein
MRIRWIKVWVDAMATLTERFRDDEGRVDFEALGREEYAFRHALVTGDFSRSERARDLYDATINEITSRSEAGRKGAEARWNKNTADGDTREDSQAKPDGSAITRNETLAHDALEPSANHYGDAATREGADESTTVSRNMRRVPQNEAPAHGFSGGRTAQGTMSRSPEAAAQSGKDYDQEPSISTDDPQPEGLTGPSHGGSVASLEARQSQALESRRAGGNSMRVAKVSTPPVRSSGPVKAAYGEFGNVMLTDDEFAKLLEKCQDADSLITELDQYIESQGKTKKYKSHYATLLNWSRRKATEAKQPSRYKNINDINRENCEQIERDLRAMFHPEEVI